MFPLGLFEVFLLIAFTDTEGLFCSKRDVIGSVEDSTVFCNIQGVLYSYICDSSFVSRGLNLLFRCGLPLHCTTGNSSLAVSHPSSILDCKVPYTGEDF